MGESLLDLSTFWWLERNLCLSVFWTWAAGGHGCLDNPCGLCHLPTAGPLFYYTVGQHGPTDRLKQESEETDQSPEHDLISNSYTCTGRTEKQMTPEPSPKTPRKPQLFPKAFSRTSAQVSPSLTRFCRRRCKDRARCFPYIEQKENKKIHNNMPTVVQCRWKNCVGVNEHLCTQLSTCAHTCTHTERKDWKDTL